MITLIKTDKFHVGNCLACNRDFDKPFAPIVKIELSDDCGHTIGVRLCVKCMRELKNKMKIVKYSL